MHPTGMHSCCWQLYNFFLLIEVFILHSEEFRMHPEMACKLDVTFLL